MRHVPARYVWPDVSAARCVTKICNICSTKLDMSDRNEKKPHTICPTLLDMSDKNYLCFGLHFPEKRTHECPYATHNRRP